MFPVLLSYRYFCCNQFVQILLVKSAITLGQPSPVTNSGSVCPWLPVFGGPPGPWRGQQEDAGSVAPASRRGLVVSENILD
jgi:hypothetical protein